MSESSYIILEKKGVVKSNLIVSKKGTYTSRLLNLYRNLNFQPGQTFTVTFELVTNKGFKVGR